MASLESMTKSDFVDNTPYVGLHGKQTNLRGTLIAPAHSNEDSRYRRKSEMRGDHRPVRHRQH